MPGAKNNKAAKLGYWITKEHENLEAMITKLKRAWKKLFGDEQDSTLTGHVVSTSPAKFELKLGRLPVGILSRDQGTWKFGYTEEYRQRKDLRPIIQFPDKDKTYTSDELWPFFMMRIPSSKQPSIKAAIEREHLDTSDRAQLLRRFGRRTVSNPYELVEER